MTSKNCCFKLMREDAKRRLWLISLLALMFVFLYPVAITSILGNYVSNSIDPVRAWEEMLNQIANYYSVGNGMIVFVMIVSSLICGITSFSYLCSKKQVDFYHAIPVRREILFLAQYINGILIVVLLFCASVFTSLLIVAVNGAFTLALFKQALVMLLVHSSFYILLYSTVVAAAMMTGNIIITILGTGVFFFYGPALLALINGYFDIWFDTFYNTGFWEASLKVASPFTFYIVSLEALLKGNYFVIIAFALLVALATTVLSMWMYKKRPSEAAGKAMAFEKTKTVIKILLVIPFSMAGCILFWGIHYNTGWSLFGLLVGGILSHCVIEIIYAFDFRHLFSHKLHMVVCLLASILIFLGFKCDITGYDSYIPEKEKLESVAVSLYNVDDWVTYGTPIIDNTGYYSSGRSHYYWDYQDSADYIFEHMEIKQVEPVLEMIRAAMADNPEETSVSYKSSYSIYPINIKYTLKSGRKVYRKAYLSDRYLDKFAAVYNDLDYRMGAYPLMKQTIDDTVSVFYQEMSHISKVELTTKEEMEELLTAYKEEWGAFTFETKKTEQPIGMIQFRTPELEMAVNQSESEYSDIFQRTYYPVYPSFTKTIQLLNAAEIYPGTKLKVDKITKITVTDRLESEDYRKDTVMAEPVSPVEKIDATEPVSDGDITKTIEIDGNIVYEFTGQKNIEHLYPSLIPRDYADLNTLCAYDQYIKVDVEYGEGMDKYSYEFVLNSEKLPEDLKTLFDYDNRKDLS